MEERTATIGGERHTLPFPFLVFATQNPIEFEGTYPLPEAQQDRFLLKVVIGYPSHEHETAVLRRFHQGFRAARLESAGIQPVLDADGLRVLRQEVEAVQVEDKVFDYVYSIVAASRQQRDIAVGASPRAGLALIACSKAVAAMRGRDFVIPDDVKELALPVLRHRVMLRPEAEIEGLTPDTVIEGLLTEQVVPR
jgi:MoxR-like ATPase